MQRKGLVVTANKGPDMNDSEFFITLTEQRLKTLEGKHTIFGEVVEGFEVLDKINSCHVDKENKPLMHISILGAHILEDPFEDPEHFEEPASPNPEDYLENVNDGEDYANMEQALEESKDLRGQEERIKKQQTKTKEVLLEMLNDIPDADARPPENVLFVCNLNPLTTDVDLETIFSQFGKIISCEIVKDWKTLDSLQYAFIEFETKESAQEAYFKMHHCLVDDRRIHVDFSQSIQYRGGKKNRMRTKKTEFYQERRMELQPNEIKTGIDLPEIKEHSEDRPKKKKSKKSKKSKKLKKSKKIKKKKSKSKKNGK
jgi:peptidyl-prolyl cis-trans isomerase-like 4